MSWFESMRGSHSMTLDLKTRQRVLIGLLQGALLLWIHKLLEWKAWPSSEPAWVVTWYLLAIAVPLALQLMEALSDSRTLRFGAGLTAVLAGMAIYTARTSFPDGLSNPAETIGYFIATVAIAWYVTLPFAQTWQKNGDRRFPYPDLFQYSWNNILTVLTAQLFVSLFWGSLMLWAGMFKIIGISFFFKLFTKPSFIYLVTGGVAGFALSISKDQLGLVSNVRGTMLLICKYLLPLSAFIGLLFLAALPFTGVKPLWDTGHATALMLNLQFYVILFLNAVYQDGRGKTPYPAAVRRLVEAGVAVLPVYAGLCAYSLGLRVEQHGWSVSRFFGALSILIAGLYGAGYCRAVLRRQTPWLKGLGNANVRIAAVVIALTVGVNTPLLDPRRIALRSQVHRLMTGAVSAEQFDYNYLRFHLGTAGQQELKRLSKIQNHPEAEKIRARAAAALAKKNLWEKPATPEKLRDQIRLFPEGKTVDPSFLQYLMKEKQGAMPTLILAIDLNGDGKEEYVVLGGGYSNQVFSLAETGWQDIGRLEIGRGIWVGDSEREKQLQQKDYEAKTPEWNLLRLGESTYHVLESGPEKGPVASDVTE